MTRLSVAMIAHNESDCIGAALTSVKWADQMVVVNCDSEDNTSDIARNLGAEVFNEPNRENLNINKNIAIDHCSGNWIFVLDADEIISDDLAGEIRCVINDGRYDGYLISRKNIILGRWLKHGGQYPDWQLRLFRKGKGRFPAEHIHERVKIDGRIGRLIHAIEHHSYPCIADLIRKGMFYVEFEAQYLYRKGVRITLLGLILKAGLQPLSRFIRRYILKGGFLDGVPGLAIAYFDLWNQAVRWLRLWEITRINSHKVNECEEA